MRLDDNTLRCDMDRECTAPISHIDEKGFIYCREHGIGRRDSGRRCRALARYELARIQDDKPLPTYTKMSKLELQAWAAKYDTAALTLAEGAK